MNCQQCRLKDIFHLFYSGRRKCHVVVSKRSRYMHLKGYRLGWIGFVSKVEKVAMSGDKGSFNMVAGKAFLVHFSKNASQ